MAGQFSVGRPFDFVFIAAGHCLRLIKQSDGLRRSNWPPTVLSMRRLLFIAAIAASAATAAYVAVRWALRERQLAEDEAAGANWANEGGAAAAKDG